MDMPDRQPGSIGYIQPNRRVIMQMRFNPSDGLREQLASLYVPEKREAGSQGIFLSSQYRMVSERLPGGHLLPGDERKAKRIHEALRCSSGSNQLSRYIRTATARRFDRNYLGLQFGVQLHPRTTEVLQQDEVLRNELGLAVGRTAVRVIFVYEEGSILEGRQRNAVLRQIGRYATGLDIVPQDGGLIEARSPNRDAYVTDARFTATIGRG